MAGVLGLVTILTFFSGLQKITNYILGIFGILFYPIMILLILILIAKALNMKFNMTSKNLSYIICIAVSLNLLLHTIFVSSFAKSQGVHFSNYFAFLKSVITYESGITVGGVITSIFTYPFMCILSSVGACIVFAIALIIVSALTLDYYLNIRSLDYLKRKQKVLNRNEIEESNAQNTSIGELLEKDQPNTSFDDEDMEDDESDVQNETFNFSDNYVNQNDNYYNENDDNLSNDDKAKSSYDPHKFSSVQEYINYPYVPQKFMHGKGSQDNSNYSYTQSSPYSYNGNDTDSETNYDYQDNTDNYSSEYNSGYGEENSDNEEDGVVNYGSDDENINVDDDIETPAWANETLNSTDNYSDESDENTESSYTGTDETRSRRRDDNAFNNSPFKAFGSTENARSTRQNRDTEVFDSPAKRFFDSAPKMQPEQLSLGVAKPKNYKQEKDRKYCPPPTSILDYHSDDESSYGGDYEKKSAALEQVLSSFNIDAKVTSVVRGPTVTQYELSMPYGTSVKKILSYDSDIAAVLMSKGGVRIEAPIPGKNAVGVEVANDKRSFVGLREMLESKEFQNSTVNLPMAIGKSISGEVVVKSLPKLVHMLIAGSTGSGKSVFLHTLILSMMYKCSPSQLRFIMIDPKRVEFTRYSGMPHMMIPHAVCECDKAINALGWAVKEMERRFKKLQQYQVQNIQDFNHLKVVTETHEEEQMAYLVIVIDELADLMMVGKKEVEEKIARLAQLGRASGIHMMIATQRPSADIITGTIKNNLPTRVALSLGSSIDSRVILDETGAEKLLGYGDMLLSAQDSNATIRLQGGFMDMDEVRKVVEYIKDHNDTYFDEELEKEILSDPKQEVQSPDSSAYDPQNPDQDELLPSALKLCIETGGASINMVQRRFRVGYARAARIIDQMELAGYISPGNGSKLRTVYMTMAEFNEKFGDDVN